MPQIKLKDHEKDDRLVRRRVLVGAAFVLLLSMALVARMYFLQVVQYEQHATLSENNRVHVQPIPPTRGLIYDRNGLIIADNRPSFSLTVTRGKRAPHTVQPLKDAPPPPAVMTLEDVAATTDTDTLRTAWQGSPPDVRAAIEARVAEIAALAQGDTAQTGGE